MNMLVEKGLGWVAFSALTSSCGWRTRSTRHYTSTQAEYASRREIAECGRIKMVHISIGPSSFGVMNSSIATINMNDRYFRFRFFS